MATLTHQVSCPMSLRAPITLLLFLLSLTFLAAQADRGGKDYALFFAVNDYEDEGFNDLTKPIENAKDLAAELSTRYGFQTEVVENPDYLTINNKIQAYHDKFSQGTFDRDGQLLIFFAGHGLEFGDDGYFASANGHSRNPSHYNLGYGYARPLIDQIPCQHIMVVVDACYSKTFDPLHRTRSNRDFGRAADIELDQVLVHHDQYTSRIFITSDSENQESPDQSSLVYAWLDALRNHRPDQGYLTAATLFGTHLRAAVPTPGAGTFGSHDAASRFLFFPTGWTAPVSSVAEVPAPTPPGMTEEEAADEDLYNFAMEQNSIIAYEFYIKDFPRGRHIEKAKRRLAILKAEAASAAAEGKPSEGEKAKTDLQLMKARLNPATLNRINVSKATTAPPTFSAVVDYRQFTTVAFIGPPASKYNKPAVEAAQKRVSDDPKSTSAKQQLAGAYLLALRDYKKELDRTSLTQAKDSKAYVTAKKELTTIADYALSLYKQVEMVTPNNSTLLSSIASTYRYLGDQKMYSLFRKRQAQLKAGGKLTSYFKAN